MSLWMVIDVESLGLHGEPFAVGWVVVDGGGNVREEGEAWSPPSMACGTEQDRAWVTANVTRHPLATDHKDSDHVCGAFWSRWCYWRSRGAVLAADVAWPCEARFLISCVENDIEHRPAQGPYPLVDIASIRLAKGLDPLATEPRLPHELPAHCALADARQSARLLLEALS